MVTLNDAIGKIYRHKRLFNYLICPESIDERMVICIAGNDIEQKIPIDYFKRDWKLDTNITPSVLKSKMEQYPKKTPYTIAFNDYFEVDDGLPHSYIHFDDNQDEKAHRFPSWKITTCTKNERDSLINPFTMIMPIDDNLVDEARKEIEIMNEIRLENEFIEFDDFQGFEFGLIKILEKKYLRDI